MKYYMPIILSLFLFACANDDPSISPEDQRDIDLEKIEDYLEANNITAETMNDVTIIREIQGEGLSPNVTDDVIVQYTGMLLDSTVFDQSTEPIRFNLGRLIPGWQVGIPMMKEKETSTIIFPSYLGYGRSGQGTIPPNSPLIFKITLDSVITL